MDLALPRKRRLEQEDEKLARGDEQPLLEDRAVTRRNHLTKQWKENPELAPKVTPHKWYQDPDSRRFFAMFFLTGGYLLVELIYGVMIGSLALIADAFHMLSDFIALIIGFYAVQASKKEPTSQATFGYYRMEVVGGLINATFLLALCLTLILDAIQRFFQPPENDLAQNGGTLIIVAGVGLGVNILGLFIFGGGHGHSHGGGHGHSHGGGSDNGHAHEEGDGHEHGEGRGHQTTESKNCVETTTIHVQKDNSEPSKKDFENASYGRSQSGEKSHAHGEAGAHGHAHGSGDKPHGEDGHGHSRGGAKEDEQEDKKHGHAHQEGDHGHSHSHGGGEHGHSHESEVEFKSLTRKDTKESEKKVEKAKPKRKPKNLNIHAVLLHVMGDALGSVAVIISGCIIYFLNDPRRVVSDPICTLFITFLIFLSGFPLVKKTSEILLQKVPDHINLREIKTQIGKVPGIYQMHDLHVWQLSQDKIVASLHILVSKDSDFMKIADQVKNIFHSNGIHASTVQPEFITETFTGSNETHLGGDLCHEVICDDDEECHKKSCCPPSASDDSQWK